MPEFRFENAGVRLEERDILKGLTLRFSERRVGVIGANGSGKSTFLRLLNGLQRVTGGTASIDGVDIAQKPKDARRKVGFLFQNPEHQIVYPTVAEDLEFGLKNQGLSRAERRQRVAEGLARFGMADFAERSIHRMSGGEKQMIALIGVMIMRPKTIVMDEPTTLLDHRNARRIMAEIARAEQQVVMATHHLDQLRGFDRVLVLEAGGVSFDGRPDAAIDHYLALPG